MRGVFRGKFNRVLDEGMMIPFLAKSVVVVFLILIGITIFGRKPE